MASVGTSEVQPSKATNFVTKTGDESHVKKVIRFDPSTAVNGKQVRRRPSPLKQTQSVAELQELDVFLKPAQLLTVERVWAKLFAAAAILDILSSILPPILRQKEARDRALALEEEERKKILPNFLTFWKKKPGHFLDLPQCVDGLKCMYERFIHWMEDHRISIAYLFIVCCMFDTARKAYYAWKSASEIEKTSSHENKKRNGINVEKKSFFVTPAHFTVVKTVLFRLSLLPIGFFTIRLVDHISILTFNSSSFIDRRNHDLSINASPAHNQNEDFSSSGTERYCVLFIIVLRFRALLLHFLQSQITSLKKVFATRLAPHIVRYAIINPRLFKSKLATLLVFFRWIKYFVPLFQKFEKLFKTLSKIIKIRRQRRKAAKAKKSRKKMWNKHPFKKQREIAALRIQSQFRAKRARRDMKLRAIFQTGRDKRITRNIRKILQMRAARARANLAKKKIELLKVTSLATRNDSDNRRSKDLKLELGSIFKRKETQRMLLRPDTKFIIGWKVMFMTCIGVEMVQKAVEHKVQGRNFVEAMFVPTHIDDWTSCTIATVGSKGLLGMFHSSNSSATVGSSEFPWYCYAPYPTIQSTYIHIVQFLISKGMTFMSIIFFLDVFVNFFTGIYDEGGFLVENNFFPRWIFPGIGFQLLVNPKVKDLSAVVKILLRDPGPAGLYKWFVAFLIPLSGSILYWFKWNVWMVLVSSQNKNTTSRK